MSGHSKWHTIKHKKGALDAKRGKLFTKLIKEITVAARTGGGDVEANARLRKAVSDAKAGNMPNDTIDRAIKRGTGELEGVSYDEITYEGYGPGGVAVMVEWMFDKKGYIVIDKSAKTEDELFEIVTEAGADDLRDDEDNFEVLTSPENFDAVLAAVKGAGVEPELAEVEWMPQTYIKLEGQEARQMLKLMEALEDHEDVQKVSANFDIDEAEMAGA